MPPSRLGFLLLLWLASVPLPRAAADPLKVEGGWIEGGLGRHSDVRVYRGIPFAAAPLGDLRWRPPAPVVPWTGVRATREFGPNPLQAPYADTTSMSYEGPTAMGEDCLYLNVWTAAAPGERLPVMVWIHGGGFSLLAASRSAYDGEELGRRGVVVVSLEYRLGMWGFLALPELAHESPKKSTGNYGLLDLVAGIKWVRRNISAFGGDPDRITLFGESAGSEAVSALTVSPLVAGDIQGAIAESLLFTPEYAGNLEEHERADEAWVRGMGIASLADLRRLPAPELMARIAAAGAQPSWQPVVDHWILPGDLWTALAGGHHPAIPILTGCNANEAATLVAPVPAAAYVAQSRQRFGSLAERFLRLYPGPTDAEAADSQRQAFNDEVAWSHRHWAELAARKRPAYLYLFTQVPPLPPDVAPGQTPRNGASHGSEIPYVFSSLDRLHRSWSEADAYLADLMSSYWANFAVRGDPNGPGLPAWPHFGSAGGDGLQLGTRIRPIAPDDMDPEKQAFWSEASHPRPGL